MVDGEEEGATDERGWTRIEEEVLRGLVTLLFLGRIIDSRIIRVLRRLVTLRFWAE